MSFLLLLYFKCVNNIKTPYYLINIFNIIYNILENTKLDIEKK